METTESKNGAGYCREGLEAKIFNLNEDAKDEALKSFAASEEALCVANADVIMRRIAKSAEDVEAGKPPEQFSSFIAGEIEKLLATKAWTECMQYELREDFTAEDVASGDINKVACETWLDLWPEEYDTWMKIVHEFALFLHNSAAFAQRIGADAAALQYIIAWRRVHAIDSISYACLPHSEAHDAMTRVREANDLLWAHLALQSLKNEARKDEA